jgi:hypothetical protein
MIARGRSRRGFVAVVARGRCRVEADVGEEQAAGRCGDPGDSHGCERLEVAEGERRERDDDEHEQDGELHEHHDRVRPCAVLRAADEQQHGQQHEGRGRQVDQAVGDADRVRECGREAEAEHRERLVHVLAGTDGDGRDGDPVFEHEAPAAHPGDTLAHRRVGVGVAGPGDGHRAGHLGVGQRRQQGREPGDRERDPHGRAGERDGGAEHDEDAGAERGADADHRELPDPERAAEGPTRRRLIRTEADERHAPAQLCEERESAISHGYPW